MGRRTIVLILTFVVINTLAPAQNSLNPPPKIMILKVGRLLDVRAGKYVLNQGVLIENGYIKRVGEFSKILNTTRSKVVVIDLRTLTLLPGLIDSHSHLFSSSDGRIDTTAQMTDAQRHLLAERNAREVLDVGITTVRNLGGSGITGDAILRDLINAGRVIGPRIVAATRKLTPPGGHGGALSQLIIDREFLIVSGTEGAHRVVREAINSGANVIKVVVDAGPRPINLQEMKAIVEETHRQNLKVAAHATSEVAIRTAVDATVDSVEHGNQVNDEILLTMREKGISLVLNLYTSQSLRHIFAAELRRSPEQKADFDDFLTNNAEQSRQRLQRARNSGVKIVAGSDMVFIYPGKTRGQASLIVLNALQEYGMPPIEIIRAATIHAAELLGWQGMIGSIEPNKYADLIAVEGDPLTDITELEQVRFVMKGGKIIRNDVRARDNGNYRPKEDRSDGDKELDLKLHCQAGIASPAESCQ